MKLNINCVRDILLTVESLDLGESIKISDLCSKLPTYDENSIVYTVLKLREANYISCVVKNMHPIPCVIKIKELTFEGHQFLADIKSDKIWSKIKEIATSVGINTINGISVTALNIIFEAVENFPS